jgi:hypothetical protein
MREFVVSNFIRSFFVGVVDIQFYEMAKKRNIQITFNTETDLKESMKRAAEAKANELFLIDLENVNLKVNRDDFETAMYMTAAKGAMEAWTTRFQDLVTKEREIEENESRQDDLQEVP